jgi:hypothetical protein
MTMTTTTAAAVAVTTGTSKPPFMLFSLDSAVYRKQNVI